MTTFSPVTIDQPAATVKVAPPGVVRDVSAAKCSGADLGCPDCDDDPEPESGVAVCTETASARRTVRAAREIGMGATKILKTR